MNNQFLNLTLREPFQTPATFAAIEMIEQILSDKLFLSYKRRYVWPFVRLLHNEGIKNVK